MNFINENEINVAQVESEYTKENTHYILGTRKGNKKIDVVFSA